MLKEHHPLPTCIFTSPTSNHFRGSGVSINGAFGNLVSATTHGALVAASLLPWALGHHVSYLMAPETSDNPTAVRVIAVEDGHFHCSPSTRWEWDHSPNDSGCFDKGGMDRGVTRTYGDWIGKTEMVIQLLICVANLQPLFTEVELSLDGHKFLHDLHDPPLGIPHQPLQHILEIAQAPITIDFPMILEVINLGERHVDSEFPFIPVPQVPLLDRGHRGMSRDPPIDLDRA